MPQSSFLPSDSARPASSVECLGMSFASDEERRTYFLERLREKLRDPEFRKIEGFPIGSDEDILALSDPPYYTACPNPFIADFIRAYGRPYDPSQMYSKEPFAADVTEGKEGDPIYDAHPYHTKVPPKAIARLISHYTQPGDIVLDAFSGSGMTGVASSLCGSYYDVEPADRLLSGSRLAILSDLSPLATFIGSVNCLPTLPQEYFLNIAEDIRYEAQKKWAWMYKTNHQGTPSIMGDIIYTIWTEFYICPNCGAEISAWESTVDRDGCVLRKEFPCPFCRVSLNKEDLGRVTESYFDELQNEVAVRHKSKPVWIHYKVGGKRFEKAPDDSDIALLERVNSITFSHSIRSVKMNFKDVPWGDFYRSGYHVGMTHVHHFFTKRNLLSIDALKSEAIKSAHYRQVLYTLTGFVENHSSKRNRYLVDKNHTKGTSCGPLPNSIYVPDLQCEVNPFETWLKTAKKQSKSFAIPRNSAVISTTESSNLQQIPDNIIDYIFIDPPFGSNILYSESSFCWEYFLGVYTNSQNEAIVSKAQKKDINAYQSLIGRVFGECYRVLKPNRWMTIEFSNRSNAIWNSISEAIQLSGFVIADVRVFDKKQGTIRQDLGQSVRNDLIISAYKPNDSFETAFALTSGSKSGVWDFVESHLRQLPIFVVLKEGQSEVVIERLGRVLFDRMVAFHVQRGVTVPLSASEFYADLSQRYPQRDDMYFLSEQVATYDHHRIKIHDLQQIQLFISDESSAIQWIQQQLINKPQALAELTPLFLRELRTWQKHEVSLELSRLLDENFLHYDGDEPIPTQITSWLRKSAEMRSIIQSEIDSGVASEENGQLITYHAKLLSAARDRWYVPNPNRAIDIEKKRLKGLLKEFSIYLEGRGKLKQFRTEAVKAGFKYAWNNKDYITIMQVAERLPESVIQGNPDLLMYYDNASLRVG